MPSSPIAISNFLLNRPEPPPLAFRKAERDVLLNEIEAVGNHELLTRTKPYLHQLQGLAFALWAERSLLYYEMRTGKTKISLDWIAYLVYSGLLTKKALIIAHAPIGVDEWDNQNNVHSYLNIAVVRSGNDASGRFHYTLTQPDIDAVLISWSTLQTIFGVKRTVAQGRRKGGEKFYADRGALRYTAQHFDAVVIDEIHMAGHDDTLRFAIASELVARCRWRLGLTGTPFGRDPLLMWAQAYLIDGGAALTTSYRFFREAFCTAKHNIFKARYTKFANDYVFDRKKLPLLKDKLQAMTLYCALSDVQDVKVLPGIVRLSMSKEQKQAYDEAVNHLVELKTGDTVEIDATFIRLRQIASGFLPFEDVNGETQILDFPDAAKFEWLADFLEDPPDLQFVVMHEFIHTGSRICELLQKHKIKYDWLRGGTKDRPQLLERFKNGKTQCIVANTATGGMAIDLSSADYLLFFESTPSVITRRQAEARPLARGNRPLVMDDLVCAPIEKKLLDFLAQGNDMREAMRRNPRDLGALVT